MNISNQIALSAQGLERLPTLTVSIANEFSQLPGARYRKDGPNSGEEFREKILEPRFKQALEQGQNLLINLDGTEGYATSFLEEAFGGLARKYGAQKVLETLNLQSLDEPLLVKEIETYIRDVSGR